MPLIVRLTGPQVTLQRRRRGCCTVVYPKTHRCGLIPSLSLAFLSVAIASVGFFIITEVGISQRSPIGKRLLTRLRNTTQIQGQSLSTEQGDFFKINPLLNKNAPNVQLSAQMILNTRYFINIKRDILNYYNSIRCRIETNTNRVGGVTSGDPNLHCTNFTLIDKTAVRKNWSSMKSCPIYPPVLKGVQHVSPKKFLPLERMDTQPPNGIHEGGWWEPDNCLAQHSIAIIIPYKDRWQHLTTLLNYLHPILKRQYIKHKIYVVEQLGSETFNKGSVMNAGFIEAMKDDIYHCIVFHDVDMIPENDENMYSCPQMPRHLSVAVNELSYVLPYPELVGGVLAIRTEHFFKVNGYSNFFWGWGGEDDDMAYRLVHSGLPIIRPTQKVGRYTMIMHKKRKPLSHKIVYRLLATSKKRYRLDGLNSVQYKLVQKVQYPWFTAVRIDIGKPHPSFKICGNQTNKS